MANIIRELDAPEYDLTITCGTDFVFGIAMLDRDHYKIPLDGWSFYLTIRLAPNREEILMEYDSINNPEFISAVNNQLTITIPRSITSQIMWRRGIYDLLSKDSLGTVSRQLHGNVYINKAIKETTI